MAINIKVTTDQNPIVLKNQIPNIDIASSTANSANYIGILPAANVVSDSSLAANLVNYYLTTNPAQYVNSSATVANSTLFAGHSLDTVQSWISSNASAAYTNAVATSGASSNVSAYIGNNSVYANLTTINTNITSNASAAYTNAVASAAALYQTTAGLSGNVLTLTANNTSFVGSISAANVVSNAQLQANLGNYQTTAGLASAVGLLASNNSTNFAGQPQSYYANTTLVGTAYSNAVSTITGYGYSNSTSNPAGFIVAANVSGLTTNNALYLGGVPAASYVNTSGAYTISGIHTHTANLVVNSSFNVVVGNTFVNSSYIVANTGLFLNPQSSGIASNTSEGSIFYDSLNHALNFYTDTVTPQEINQQMFVRVVNKTAAILTAGQVVYIDGPQGNRPTAILAKGDSILTHDAAGLVYDNIAINAEGFVLIAGLFQGYDTRGFVAGDTLYVSTATAGGLTNIKPTYPSYAFQVGTALNSTVSGKILVELDASYASGQPNNSILVSDGYRPIYNTNFQYTYSNNTLFVGNSASTSTASVIVSNTTGSIIVTPTTINIGSSSVNSTVYTGSSNNTSYLGGTAAASYITNTGNYTLSGNISFTGKLTTNSINITTLIANTSPGLNGQLLTSNGSSIYWSTVTVPTPAGANGQLQFNNSGAFGSDADLTYDYANNVLSLGNLYGYDFSATSFAQFKGSSNNFYQVAIQNANTGTNASTDLLIVNDAGNNFYNFVDLGINSSNYSNAVYSITGPGDAYLFASNGNFAIGTATVKDIIFHAGGTALSNKVLTVNTSFVTVADTVALKANTAYFGNSTSNSVFGYNASDLSVAEFAGNSNNFLEVVLYNSSSGNNASADFIVNDNNGPASSNPNYIDVGINGSNFNQTTWTISGPSDGYVYTGNTDLSVGTAGNGYINFFTGGTLAANERLRISQNGYITIANSSPLVANGSPGTLGQVLSSNGMGVYWATSASGGGSNTNVVSINTTVSSTDDYILASGTINITLPTVSGINGRKYYIKNSGTGVITILPNGAETINTNSNLILLNKNSMVGLLAISASTDWTIF